MPKPVPIELVEAARAGGRDGIELLLAAVWPDAYRLARAVLGDEATAQDAAQEACIVLVRTIASLRSSTSFRSWFYRIVVRESAELKWKRSRIDPVREEPVDSGDRAASLDIWRALGALAPKLREVVVLRYFEDLSSREIAAVLGIPAGTVRFRLMIATRRLRALLDDDTELFPQSPPEVRTNAI